MIDASDVVIEVLDARDPLGCRCPQLEEAVLQREGNKKLLFVLNKIGKWTRDAVVLIYSDARTHTHTLMSRFAVCCEFE